MLHDLVFNKVPFWVQVQNIPIRYVTKKVTETICEPVEGRMQDHWRSR